MNFKIIFIIGIIMLYAAPSWSLSSANIPLDSPLYTYLDKLAGFGLITSDIKGIKPFSKAEAARLVLEAENAINKQQGEPNVLARGMIRQIKKMLPREVALYDNKTRQQLFDVGPLVSARMRYVYFDGLARDYQRQVHDPGNDGVFGIGQGLRPRNSANSYATQHGTEGTPLMENNEGTVYPDGNNVELRVTGEAYLNRHAMLLAEPQVLFTYNGASDTKVTLNRGYLKLGGGAVELEVGRDANWLGLGYRGAITLSNNPDNLDLVKISSPEPFRVNWLAWLGEMKYSLLFSRLDKTVTNGKERQPWFYALKLISKPTENLEIGFNLGRQVGGPGVKNGIGDTLRGLIGGTNADNSNGLAGFEARYRIPWLRNTELYGEFSGEDTAAFWPIVESYLAGFYIPCLTADGKNDFRFEFFQGNQILYTNGTFPEGYLYKGMPLGHSQGGATQDFFTRYSHWFTPRNNLALEYIYTNRGMVGRKPGQSIERKHAGRIFWSMPLNDDTDAQLGYGIERISNLNLKDGRDRTNQLMKLELRYRY